LAILLDRISSDSSRSAIGASDASRGPPPAPTRRWRSDGNRAGVSASQSASPRPPTIDSVCSAGQGPLVATAVTSSGATVSSSSTGSAGSAGSASAVTACSRSTRSRPSAGQIGASDVRSVIPGG